MSPCKQMHNEPLPEALPPTSFQSVRGSIQIFIFVLTILINAYLAGPARAESNDEMSRCAQIENEAERLKCYDELVDQKEKQEIGEDATCPLNTSRTSSLSKTHGDLRPIFSTMSTSFIMTKGFSGLSVDQPSCLLKP